MKAQPPKIGVIASLLAAMLLGSAAQPLLADTIHLKNGRTMKVDSARIEGDEVVFFFAGNEARIPKSLVDKIVKEDPAATPDADGDADPTEEGVSNPPETGDATPEDDDTAETAVADEEAPDEVDPAATREYWQQRVRDVYVEQAEIDDQIESLRREERAFLFSHRSTDETKRKIEAAQARRIELDQELTAMRREARRKRIPPGWLRVRVR